MSSVTSDSDSANIAVVIPCYRVQDHVAGVVERIGPEVRWIICVNDASTDTTGQVLEDLANTNGRATVLTHDKNRGVGGAVKTGYLKALELGADVVVKLDGDGQMAPEEIGALCAPILRGEADYTKGNRFHNLDTLNRMPLVRLVGNAALTFISKFSTGYYSIFDPTNGYTAIHADALRLLPLNKIHDRYFFESDILFRLNIIAAVPCEVPMEVSYGDEQSNLSIPRVIATFPGLHMTNLCKRVFYNYFLRNFSIASLNLVIGSAFATLGTAFGLFKWLESMRTGTAATAGTVMLAALPIIMGLQLVLSFLNYDMTSQPKIPLQKLRAHHSGGSQSDT